MPRRPARLLSFALVASLALVACSDASGSDKRASRRSSTPSPSESPSPSPTPVPSPTPQLKSPFTGRPVDALRPVLAVKIDNVAPARPQAGLNEADLVYEELVEGGQTRFLAVYSSTDSGMIGPIRSVRESDLELLAAYGRVVFAFSGGNDGVKASVNRANVINASWDYATKAYRKIGGRKAPYNLASSTTALLAAKPGGAPAKDIGLRFGPLRPGHSAAPKFTLTWSPFARTGFAWNGTGWLRYQNGVPAKLLDGSQMTATSVIVQYVPIRSSRYVDVTGARTPYTVTVGSGAAEVYRDGRRVTGRWVRPSKFAPTRFVDAAGRDLGLPPGPVWILLAPNTTRVAVG